MRWHRAANAVAGHSVLHRDAPGGRLLILRRYPQCPSHATAVGQLVRSFRCLKQPWPPCRSSTIVTWPVGERHHGVDPLSADDARASNHSAYQRR